jgi:Flp pilus assembly secretin CpaC
MIQKLKSVIILAALSLAPPVALSQDSTLESNRRAAEILNLPKQIRVQVEFIEMPHEELTNLMTKPRSGANDQDLRDACTKLVEQNKATILETTSVIARSGQKASTESITEFIYPTEWKPYELPNQLEAPESDESPKALELIPQPTPTAFETRNLGTTLQVEPTLGEEGRIIDLRLDSELVFHAGNENWSQWVTKKGDGSIKMPTMYSIRLNTGLTMIDGQPCLVAVQSPKDDSGKTDFTRKIAVFVRCDVLIIRR